jgi:hypothetical protein
MCHKKPTWIGCCAMPSVASANESTPAAKYLALVMPLASSFLTVAIVSSFPHL